MEHERELVLRLKQMALLVGGAAIANKYDPGQPRVPAGNPDGGQWTDGAGGPDGSARARSRERPLGISASSGRSSFALISRGRSAGSVETSRWRSGDGVEIVSSERRGGLSSPAFTRHEVRDAGGNSLTVEAARGVQRILDGDGNLLSATRWGENGPEPVRLAQLTLPGAPPLPLPMPGQAPRLSLPYRKPVARAMRRLESGLFNFLSAHVPGVAVLGYRAHEFVGNDDGLDLEYAGVLALEQARSYCPAYEPVQNELDRATRELSTITFATPQERGTAIHNRTKTRIDSWRNENVKAEITYGTPENPFSRRKIRNSKFLDVFERVAPYTACVYDHKTGAEGLSSSRVKDLAFTARKLFPEAFRIIVFEMRPSE